MNLFFICLIFMVSGGFASLMLRGRWKLADLIGAGAVMAGSAGALAAFLPTLFRGRELFAQMPWPLPMGAFTAEIDALSGLFLCAIFILAALAAFYGWGYAAPAGHDHGKGFNWFWMSLLVGAMALVVVARDAVLFLLAWELMSLSSFFLVAFDNNLEKVRRAAWIYLVATHLGTAFLLVMFSAMGATAGTLDFAAFASIQGRTPAFAGTLFVLALVGFGTKAGFYPLHVWLPEAHPAAPSHVSALMSGVMIKTGIYALLRIISIIGPPPPWWGWVIVAAGASSGLIGVVFALAQHDLKRLLAYHSVENIGIIAMGLGLGLLGWSYGDRLVMLAGFAGCLLHVINHAIFKGLLFMSAGSVLHATGCRDMEMMGGLLKKMPVTGWTFLTGSAAICGLPPLNGFVSEFMIYTAALLCVLNQHTGAVLPGIVVIGALAMIGGLAAACFTKAFGVVFLGEPRSAEMTKAHECCWRMRLPMICLAAACLAVALAAPLTVPALSAAAGNVVAGDSGMEGPGSATLRAITLCLSAAAAGFLVLLLILARIRHCLLRRRAISIAPTWDCGFARPTARMQYTAASFAQPVTNLFRNALDIQTQGRAPKEFFPGKTSFSAHADDTANRYFFAPIFRSVDRFLARLLWIQEGRVQVYVLYITVTLLALLLVAL